MNSSSAFKSVVAISITYVAGKIIDSFTTISIKKEDTKVKIEEIKKEVSLKEINKN